MTVAPLNAIVGGMRHRNFLNAAFRARRLELGLTHKQVADRAGVSESFVRYAEKNTQPSDPYAAVLAHAVDLTPDDLSTPKPDADAA